MLGWILITSLAQGGQRDTALSCAEAKQFFQDDLSVTLTRVCSTLRDCSGVSYTAAQVRIDYFQGQAMSLLLLSSPTTKKKTKLPPRHTSFWDIPCSCRGFSSLLHHRVHLTEPASCHKKARKSLGTSTAWWSWRSFLTWLILWSLSCCWSLRALGTWAPILPGARYSPFQSSAGSLGWKFLPWQGLARLLGHHSPTWRDDPEVGCTKGSDRWKAREKLCPEQPVQGRHSPQTPAVCHLLQIF